MAVRIISTSEEFIAGFRAVVDAVARERKYLAFIEAPPMEKTLAFVRGLLANGGVQLLAVTDTNSVVGWCDVARHSWAGLRHVGRLGMGLLPEYRGQGHGQRLAEATVEAARKAGIERIELEVFASNLPAIRLYEKLGFQHEGLKKRFRKLDGEYDDNVMMALLSNESEKSRSA
jgi:RimJ/RimL family protein N-acetyltransferase